MPSVKPFRGSYREMWAPFFILWRYERKQPRFVRSCVRMWFGRRGMDILWEVEGMSGLVWEAFRSLYMSHSGFLCNNPPVTASL